MFAISVFLLVFFLFADVQHIVCRIPDDSSHFFKIAENVASGSGSTFDGINRTNGYQALWLCLLIPVSLIFHLRPEDMVRVYLVYQLVPLIVAYVLLYRLHSLFFSTIVTLASAVFFIFLTIFQSATGMDSAILVLMMVLLFFFGWWGKVFVQSGWLSHFVFGVLLGLTMLARLDAVFLGASVCAFVLLQALRSPDERRIAVKRLALVLAGSVLVVAPYLLYNLRIFGDMMPISGILKSSFPYVSFSLRKLEKIGSVHAAFVVVAIAYLIWSAAMWHKYVAGTMEARFFRGAMAVLALSIILHFVHTMLFIKWGIFRWQFISYALFASLVISEPLSAPLLRWKKRGLRLATGAVLVLLFLSGMSMVVKRTFLAPIESSWHVASYRAAMWARDNVNANYRLAMKDCGHFGYFSQRSVVNLDGAVNNTAYQDVIDSGRLNEYLRKCNVCYIVQHGIVPSDTQLLSEVSGGRGSFADGECQRIALRYKGMRNESYSEPVVLRREDEVYRKRFSIGDGPHTLVIWR